jgi:serine/threonine protein phosphatase PrpC
MTLQMFGTTTVGRRNNNEDGWLHDSALGLTVVSDGMGGYEGGEIASAVTLEAMRDFIARNRRDPEGTWPEKPDKERSWTENVLAAAAHAANRAIFSRREGRLSQMGATVVAALVDSARIAIAHVGDSRAYRLRAGALTQVTRDHSAWEELRASGVEVADRANYLHKNFITRALGIEPRAKPEVSLHALEPGDTWLLCSDGLFDPLSEDTIARLLALPSPKEACEALVESSFAAGSTDNITAVVLRR